MAVPRKRWISIIIFVVIAVILIVVSMSRMWVERNFSTGIYPYTSALQRMITGWIPFSIGDVVYVAFLTWLAWVSGRNVYLLFVKKVTVRIVIRKFSKFLLSVVGLYVVFLVIWGLNYSRKGIRYQLNLERPDYEFHDLLNLQKFLLTKVNESKDALMQVQTTYPSNTDMFQRAAVAFQQVSDSFPYLKYRHPSIKSSLFGRLTNYFGFTGYYNPFSGEAQVNTTVPRFLIPSITVHEIAHQIGYARENEANFVGFLVGSHSDDALFRYSSWLDLFMYTNSQVRSQDSLASRGLLEQLSEPVKQDIREWRRFSESHRSFIEPVFHWVYGIFLNLNKQPQGMKSYDAVVSLAVAYYKKQGIL